MFCVGYLRGVCIVSRCESQPCERGGTSGRQHGGVRITAWCPSWQVLAAFLCYLASFHQIKIGQLRSSLRLFPKILDALSKYDFKFGIAAKLWATCSRYSASKTPHRFPSVRIRSLDDAKWSDSVWSVCTYLVTYQHMRDRIDHPIVGGQESRTRHFRCPVLV